MCYWQWQKKAYIWMRCYLHVLVSGLLSDLCSFGGFYQVSHWTCWILYAAWTASDPQSQALLVPLATAPRSKSRSRRVRGKITLHWGWWVLPSPHTHIPWARGLSCSRCRTQSGLVVSSIHSTSLRLPTVWLHLQVTTSCGLFKLVFQEMLSGCSSWGEAYAE